jgi:ribosomal protein S18 acetylase RimI-like enzyme
MVVALAAGSFEWSRLHLDPAIPNEVADRSRAEWVANFFTAQRGDVLLVAENEGLPAAFLLGIGPKDGILTIDLVAVSPGARRRGLGTACVAFAGSQIAGVERLRVGTQAANVSSLRFYEQLGFRTIATHYVLHLHRF